MSGNGHDRNPLFAGLLLILLGGIFLLYRFDPALGIGHLLARYWPVLIILWGFARLVEHWTPQQNRTAQSPFLSGGEAALMAAVIVALCLMAAHDIVHRRLPNLDLNLDFNTPATQTQKLTPQTIPAGSHIAIQTGLGNITVHGGDGAQLLVTVNTSTNGFYFFPGPNHRGGGPTSGSENEGDQAANAEVVIEQTDLGYSIHPEGQFQFGPGGRLTVNLDVQVPKDVQISATANHGAISVTGVSGSVSAEARDGNVEIHDAGGSATVTMQRGDAHIAGVAGDVSLAGRGSEVDLADIAGGAMINGNFFGPIRANRVGKTLQCSAQRSQVTLEHLTGEMILDSGRIEISDVTGPAKIATRHKDVSAANIAGRLDVADTHGDVEVRYSKPPQEDVNVQNNTGEVEVNLPANSNFEIAAASAKGEAHSDFEAPTLNVAWGDAAGAINGRVGTGGPKISVSTTYGTIHLRKTS